MRDANAYINKWLMNDEPSDDSKVAVSARIPAYMNERIEQLAAEFGISKTEALIASIDIGSGSVLSEWERAQRSRDDSQLPAEPKPPMTLAEFTSCNPSKSGEELEMSYHAYLEHAQEAYELQLGAYEAIMENL